MCTKNGSYCEKEKKVGGGEEGGQGRCERLSEGFVEIQKKYFFFVRGGGSVGEGWGSQGGFEQRSEAFVEIKNKIGGCRVGGSGLGGGQGGCERRS